MTKTAPTAQPDTTAVTAVVDQVDDPSVVHVTKDGRVISQIDEDELDAELVLRYQAMAAGAMKQGKGGEREINSHKFCTASQWLILQLFQINGSPMTIDNLVGKPSENPKCIGFKAVAKLTTIAMELMAEMPTEGKG